jgi:hypothetical protein
MPDPRQPQRPQPPPHQRQPAPQPQRSQPGERPVPHDPNADKVPGIHVGDPNAVAKRAAARPVRPLDPSQQPPPVEVARKLRKGETYHVMGDEALPTPRKGKIIRLSSEPGKGVGIEFDEPVGGTDESGQSWGVMHTCDGRGKLGHCLYVRPDMVLDDKAMAAHKAHQAEVSAESSKYEEFDEITVGPQDSHPLTPAMEGRETMTIGPGDVGTISAKDLTRGKPRVEEEDEDEDK